MKTKIYVILGSLLFMLVACDSDKDLQPSYPVPEDTMKMTVSANMVVLNMDEGDKAVVTFKWNQAAQREAGAEISYYFKFWLTADPSTALDKIKLSSDAREFSLTNAQLSAYLIDIGKVAPGEKVEMRAEVIADINSTTYMKPEVSVVSFLVETYKE